MNNDPHDCSTEDEGVDEDMMFEFEEELGARLSLHDVDRPSGSSPHVHGPRASAFSLLSRDTPTPTPPMPMPSRPQNPVAAVLDSENEILDDTSFASISPSPFASAPGAFGAAMATCSTPATHDKSPSFDFNGRRKRKFFDDSCCVTPRVRPLAKRAKSFSSVDQVLLPDCGFKSIDSTNFVPCTSPAPYASTSTGTDTSARLFASARSKSIQIPHRDRRAAHHPRSSSGPSRGTMFKAIEVPTASSDPLATRASSSWNASVEYFCRRSLDISSPLRTRFRDLVVGSVGRAGGLKSP